ncbi:hypothetical protein AU467_25145 [Mesorhizobium loti]|uniref:Uncharacterized protein n=1 Tax=Rhizobium loti TaxID=381 RepID=A0A117N3B7_RHILI|nr:hypothetical protein AU467_25145 [Mesorhizobium loti]
MIDGDQRLVQHRHDSLGTSGVTPAPASGIARRSEYQVSRWRKHPRKVADGSVHLAMPLR